MINEIKRLQQLAGITEIKVNNPLITPEIVYSLYDKLYQNDGENFYDTEARDILDEYIPHELNTMRVEDYEYIFTIIPNDILVKIYKELKNYENGKSR